MKQKTAVEFLIEQIKLDQQVKALSEQEWINVIEEAKELEKRQIVDAYVESAKENSLYNKLPDEDLKIEIELAEQYYTQNYGNDND